ncbi:hypothetical protein SGPA1_40238 [Streptomyces misionensis JCM 4497]
MTVTDAARVTTVRQRRAFVLPGSVQGTPISTLAAIAAPLPRAARRLPPSDRLRQGAMATSGGLSVLGATAGTGEGDPARGERGTRQVERPSPARHGARRQPGGEGDGPEGHHERYRERPTPGDHRRADAATPGPSPRRRPPSASSPS